MSNVRDWVKEAVTKEMEETGSVPLKAVLVRGDSEVIPVLFAGLNKEQVYQALKRVVRDVDPDVVYVISESWVVTANKDIPNEEADLIVPSEHPDRVEVVVIQELTPTGTCFMRADIEEVSGRRCIGEFEEIDVPYSLMKGPLADIFPEEKKIRAS